MKGFLMLHHSSVRFVVLNGLLTNVRVATNEMIGKTQRRLRLFEHNEKAGMIFLSSMKR